ncbi:MAG: DUF6884 domain-containing protein, partial [Kiloniellales bacterium]
DLYASDWFSKARSYVESTSCPWFILSAEYGLVAPNQIINSYEMTLNRMPIRERRRWAERVVGQMSDRMPDAQTVIFLAGQRYREFLVNHLRRRGVAVETPMEGLRIGEQLRWLSRQVGRG